MRLFLTFAFSALGLGGAAPSSDVPARPEIAAAPAPVRDHFTDAEIDRSRRYNGPRRARSLFGLALGLAVSALLAFGPLAHRFAGAMAAASGGRAWLAGALAAAGVIVVGALISLPLGYLALRHDRDFGLSTQSSTAFLLDRAKSAGFELAIGALVGAGLVALVRTLPRGWPVAAALGAAALTVALVLVFPVIYEPAFNRFTPAPPAVAQRVETIARASGVQIGEVLVIDASRRTTRHNAYVSGIGPTRRVVLYDTLLDGAPDAEVDLVVAHELAHVRHGDVVRGTLLGVVGAIGAIALVWLTLRIAGVAADTPRAVAVAMLVFALGTLLTSPVTSAFSRSLEARADATAIDVVAATRDDLAGTVRTAVDLEVRLARTNLADLQPPRWVVWAFASHPPVLERIAAALERAPLERAPLEHGARA